MERMNVVDFKVVVELANLKQIRVGDTENYIVWKPGTPTGWIVRLGDDSNGGCFCSDYFSLYCYEGDRDVVRQINNIGLTAVAVGFRSVFLLNEESVERSLREFSVGVIPLTSSEVYNAFLSVRKELEPQT